MNVRHARAVARQWVIEEGTRLPGFAGAFFHGSAIWLPDEAPLPASSDVDVMVVVTEPEPPAKLGKFRYQGVIIEASYLDRDQLRTPEQVLGQYHLAGSLRTASIIVDPSGELTRLQMAVARDFARRRWVRVRCEHACEKIISGHRPDPVAPFHDQVIAWLFPTGITTHVLLTAGLKNPTVRTRYLAVRSLLAEYGRLEIYEPLLTLLGCAGMTPERAMHHLAAMAMAFDAAKDVITTPFSFASDISDLARPVAVDGSLELVGRRDHREAIFWMVATYSRCQAVFAHDAPALYERFDVGYRELLADLGITSASDLHRCRAKLIDFLPRLWREAELIMTANPAIAD